MAKKGTPEWRAKLAEGQRRRWANSKREKAGVGPTDDSTMVRCDAMRGSLTLSACKKRKALGLCDGFNCTGPQPIKEATTVGTFAEPKATAEPPAKADPVLRREAMRLTYRLHGFVIFDGDPPSKIAEVTGQLLGAPGLTVVSFTLTNSGGGGDA